VQAFSAQIQSHKSDFQNEIHETNGFLLLRQGLTKRFFAEVLKAHDGLIGTVLGYGRENAWSYHNHLPSMESFIDADEQAKIESYFQSQGSWKFFTGNICRDFSHLFLPGFKIQQGNVETQMLKEKYASSREKIRKLYADHDCLVVTLQLLMQYVKK
jgi:hypothetical protein